MENPGREGHRLCRRTPSSEEENGALQTSRARSETRAQVVGVGRCKNIALRKDSLHYLPPLRNGRRGGQNDGSNAGRETGRGRLKNIARADGSLEDGQSREW